MSDFDKVEWMEENEVKPGVDWLWLRGKPRTEYCDVRLRTGVEVGPCWPRLGKSMDFVNLSDESSVAFSDVTHVRYYEAKGPGDKDDEPDVGDGEPEEGADT